MQTLQPSRRLFITPQAEVHLLCRLALLAHLDSIDAALAKAATSYLDGDAAPGGADVDVWERLKAVLTLLRIVDPACGEGHILIGMLDLLDDLVGHADQLLGMVTPGESRRASIVGTNLFGVEAQISRWRQASSTLSAATSRSPSGMPTSVSLNLARGDSLVESEGFSWIENFRAVMNEGGFHLVLGNPPFVRHELIEDPLGQVAPKEYKCRAFAAAQRRLDTYPGRPGDDSSTMTLNRRSDLSVLFTVFGVTLLRPGGVLGFVLPSAVTSAAYGVPLWKLLDSFDLRGYLVEDLTRRSFGTAAVNTTLLLASRRSATMDCTAPGTTVPPVLGPSAAVARSAVVTGAALDGLRRRIEERCAPLISLGRLRYPIKTGLNRFFYPDAETRRHFQLEADFLVPVVKSPRDVRRIRITQDELPSTLFHCLPSTAELGELGAAGALAYITWGAEQVTPRQGAPPVPWPSVPSLAGRKQWYSLALPPTAQILCPRFLYQRVFFALPGRGITEDQTLYGLELSLDLMRHRSLIGALLNSSLAYLMMESHGRTGLGDGVRQYALRDMATLLVPDPKKMNWSLVADLMGAFEALAARPILSISEEVLQDDRAHLDDVVCRALNLPERDGHDARHELSALVARRLQRAGSV